MKIIILMTFFLISTYGLAAEVGSHTPPLTKSQLTIEQVKKLCWTDEFEDESKNVLCLMNRGDAENYCQSIGMKLPSVFYFMNWARSLGASYLGGVPCGKSRTCQLISPTNEESLYYNSDGFTDDSLPDYWYHTSSLKDEGVNYHFSVSGFISSSSDDNPGNVVCIKD